MPWKDWNTRLTETMADINNISSTKGAVGQDYINGLTVPNRKLLSNAIKQGAYATNPQGEAIEKAERATRRALLLALIAHANTGVPANDRATGIAACKDYPGDKRGLLNAELSDLERAIRQIKARGSIAKCADCADTWRDWDGTRQNPLLAGSAIGQRGTNGPGTLGCFVRYKGEIF